MEEAELFVVPSSVDVLFERVWEEVSVSSLSQNEDHSNFKEKIRRLCQRFSPCNTWQMYSGIVDSARDMKEERDQGLQEGERKERRKGSLAALMELKEGDIQLQLSMGKANSNVNPRGHYSAIGEQKQLHLKSIPLDEDERCDIRSCFMTTHLRNATQGPQKYHNESDVQRIVQIVLEDAVAACNVLLQKFRPHGADGEILGKEGGYHILQCFTEQSLWTDRPDHTVVCDSRSGAPLLTVETKKPITQIESQGSSLSTYAKTRGQGYDYLRLMQFMGHSHPIHVTTTIEETYVAWLEDNSTMEIYNKPSFDARECWSAAAKKTFQKLGMEQLTQSPVKEQQMERPMIDGGIASTRNPAPRTRSRSQSPTVHEELLERKIFHSQALRSHELFHVFVDAILYGVLGAYSSPVLPTLYTGERVSRQLALKLASGRFEWVLIDATVTGPLPSPEERNFLKVLRKQLSSPQLYAIGVVGVGATSKVFRVITNEGYEGVAKIYIKKHNDRKMQLTKAEFLEEANRSINTELQIFHATYPKVPVSKIKLHGHPSLLMPYFGSDCPPNDTWKEKVMDDLRKLKDSSGNPLKYKDDDVRWRHICLCRESKQVQLFDFNDMEIIESKDQIEDEVERQWKILAGRIRQGTDNKL